jgi:two-component system nitrate/nitrite response regulator NarL
MMPAGAASAQPVLVVLVDDHRLFAEVLGMRLRAEPGIAGVEPAYSLGAARALVNKLRPEVVLLDYDLGGECGLDLLDDLERLDPRPRVVMVSAGDDPSTIISALRRGVDAWVTKDADLEVLVHATSEVLAGRMYLPPAALRPLLGRLLNGPVGGAAEPSFVAMLSAREVEVLRCLVAGMTRAETAQRLFISTNTVRTHVQHLLQRAGLHSTGPLVAAARELGVRGIDEPSSVRIPRQRGWSE